MSKDLQGNLEEHFDDMSRIGFMEAGLAEGESRMNFKEGMSI